MQRYISCIRIIWHGAEFVILMTCISYYFEIALCVVMSSQGKYHCKYMKYTAYGITTSDGITRADNVWDFIPCDYAIYIPAVIVGVGISATFLMSLRHFYKVKQLKRRKDELHRGRTE